MGMIDIGALRTTVAIDVVEATLESLDTCDLTNCMAEDRFFDVKFPIPATLCSEFMGPVDATSSITTEVLTADAA